MDYGPYRLRPDEWEGWKELSKLQWLQCTIPSRNHRTSLSFCLMMVESLLWGWKKSRLWQEILFQQSLPAALLLLLLSHSNNLCLLLHPAALPTGAPDFRKQVFTATKESSSFLTADFVLNYSKVQCVKTSLSLSTSWLVVLLSGWLVGHLGTDQWSV